MTARILIGDCLDVCRTLDPASIDLIVTSPPYADARKSTYGGIPPDKYVEWFLPRAAEFQRVLKPTGTFILNLKEKVVKGERSTYVLELILALRQQGWLWTEEFIWHKKNCFPGKWPNRFRDAWERLLQFNIEPKFAMYQDAVLVPAGDWQRVRLAQESRNDGTRQEPANGSRFGRKVSNWNGRLKALPTNVLSIAPETRNQNHSAAFPAQLPEFFIKCFTQPGDVVLDPFAGSGTVGLVAERLGRDSILVDTRPEYGDLMRERLKLPPLLQAIED